VHAPDDSTGYTIFHNVAEPLAERVRLAACSESTSDVADALASLADRFDYEETAVVPIAYLAPDREVSDISHREDSLWTTRTDIEAVTDGRTLDLVSFLVGSSAHSLFTRDAIDEISDRLENA